MSDLTFKELIERYNRELMGMHDRSVTDAAEQPSPEPSPQPPVGIRIRVTGSDGTPVSGAVIFAGARGEDGCLPLLRAVSGEDGMTGRLDGAFPDGTGIAEIFADGYRRESVEISGEGVYEVEGRR